MGKAERATSEVASVEQVVEEILKALDKDFGCYRPTLVTVESIVRELALEGDSKVLARKALNRARRRIRQAVEGLWNSLKAPLPPPPEVKRSWRGETLGDWPPIPFFRGAYS
jgi:hypothetical protein